MTDLGNILRKLTRRLYPTGRAFRLSEDSWIFKVHDALIETEKEMVLGGLGVLDSILADNDSFTTDDAADWERRLAIEANTSTSLSDRKAAILRKYAHPGDIPNRASASFMEREIRAAGFDLYVHENIDGDAPGSFDFYSSESPVQLGQKQLGQTTLGTLTVDTVANYVDPVADSAFSIGSEATHVFFVGGVIKGDGANVAAGRELELRQLILKLKQVQTVAVLFVNYV